VNLTQVTDLNGAVRGVLKRALQVDGVIRGLHEASGDGFWVFRMARNFLMKEQRLFVITFDY